MADLNKNEEDILKYWNENKIPDLVAEKNRGKKKFYFLDGPPFVSGDLHPGQMWVKSMKDVVLRYRRLRGYDVYARAGYDVHGLPIEKKVEAKLNVKTKKEIETTLGIDTFIRNCKEYVNSYMGRMDSDYRRFGMSLDFSNPYIPSTKSYMEIEWQFLKRIYDKGLIYKQKRATTYCKSCQTAVSQGSMELEYKEDNDPSVLVAFRVNEGKSGAKVEIKGEAYLLIWTTTPWTLPANMAVAANPKELYILARIGGKRLIFAKGRLEFVSEALDESAVIESEFYGSELSGLQYLSPLEGAIEKQKEFRKYHKVVMAEELVTINEGSGLVHIAPGHGLEDYLVGKREKIPIFSPVGEQGEYTGEAGKYSGLVVQEQANKAILADLKAGGSLLHHAQITHSYPHCWRCDTKLIYIATEQWFINIQRVKKRLIRENRKVSWHPAEASKWQEEILQGSPDWTISRQRYWGTPIPIWICECGEQKVIGSLAELAENATNRAYVESLDDLHRDSVDKVRLKCVSCGKEMRRISDVLDVWFDSSVAYRASLTQEQFDSLFPVDFILEGVDQLRGWFSYQLKMGTIINGRNPFRHVGIDGMMLGSDGREMHKKLGNYVPLSDVLKSATADSFRLWCTSHVPQLDITFSPDKISDANKTVRLLYNIANLYEYYSDAVGYRPKKLKASFKIVKLDPEERWIYLKMNATVREVTRYLDNYEIHKGAEAIRAFITEDLSRFYLRMAKKKLLYADRRKARLILDLINHLLFKTLVMISPYTPFAAERIYLDNYWREKSITLESWPRSDKNAGDQDLLGDFETALAGITALLFSREKEGLKLRQPLMAAHLEVTDQKAYDALVKLSSLIEDYINVKKLDVKMMQKASLEIRPAFQKLGPEFKGSASAVAEGLKKADPDAMLGEIEKTGHYQLHTEKGTFSVTNDHFTVIRKVEKENAVSFKAGIAYVDKEISRELRDEAIIREFERGVQLARKDLMLKKSDRITLLYRSTPDIAEIIAVNGKKIAQDVNAIKIDAGEDPQIHGKEIELEDETIRIYVRKV